MPTPTPEATPAVGGRMLCLEWPRRMPPTETKHVILRLADVVAEPEQVDATVIAEEVAQPEQGPSHYLYGIASLRAKLNCEPACNKEITERVPEGGEVEWRWVLGPNPELEGRQHAKVDFRWCWKEKPNDRRGPCTSESPVVFEKSFDIDLASGPGGPIPIPIPGMYWMGLFAGGVVSVAAVVRALGYLFGSLQSAASRVTKWARDAIRRGGSQ